jgi:Tfp pilus assembly protein PilV
MQENTARDHGFSLVESVLAIGVLATALITLAQLISTSVATSARARHTTVTAVLAAQKMEELRSARVLEAPAVIAEYLDASGRVTCVGMGECASMVYVRRWSMAPFAAQPDAVLIQVSVAHLRVQHREARLASVRARIRE